MSEQNKNILDRYKNLFRKSSQFRLMLRVYSFLFLSLGVIIIIYYFLSPSVRYAFEKGVIETPLQVLMALMSIVFGLFFLYALRYLQGSTRQSSSNQENATSSELRELRYVLLNHNDRLIEQIEHSTQLIREQQKQSEAFKFDLGEDNKRILLDSLRTTMEKTLSSEFLKSIEDKYSQQVVQNAKWDKLLNDLIGTRERLLREIGDLSRRSNLNLVIGSTTTLIAGTSLLYIAFNSPILIEAAKDIHFIQLLSYFIPRLSVVIFIEVFAYFFLRLYKSGLNDIKFYQNELTNVELKVASLKTSMLSDDKDVIKLVITELSRTERNFILKPGESTVELEKTKFENKYIKDILEQIGGILKNK